jgi:hypothetical protein
MASKNGDLASAERTRQDEAAAAKALANGVRGGQDGEETDKTELLEQLTDDDLTTTDDALQNLKTKDIPSANFSDEEALEHRHYLDVVHERMLAAKPHEGQEVVGIIREWAHDDPSAGLEPPSKRDLLVDETARQGVAARVSKGKNGTLIGLALRSIRESVLRRDGSTAGSSGGGILGRLRK